MNDLNFLGAIRSEKEKYTSFTEKIKFGEDPLFYEEDVQSATDRIVILCTNIQRYFNAIHDEIQSLEETNKSFIIHLVEKMAFFKSGHFKGKISNKTIAIC